MDKYGSGKRLPKSEKRSKKIGIFLVILSFVLYGVALLVPFLPLTVKTKVIAALLCAVIGEMTFWVGGVILGKELIKRYRKQMNPLNWLKKRKNKGDK